MIYHGDCFDIMRTMEENSVDAVVCDPPYGLFFMGNKWDKGMPPALYWQAALRVAKPGAYLLAFGGTRKFHRLACAIEDAGWILRDTLMWVYGSGFPKSHDVSKAFDRKAGAEREVIGKKTSGIGTAFGDGEWNPDGKSEEVDITIPATPEAKQWDGFGTALKPSWEPVVLAQAPFEGTYAENIRKWGCGALNVNGCLIGSTVQPTGSGPSHIYGWAKTEKEKEWKGSDGRWPANFLLSHSLFCEKVGERKVRASLPASGPTSEGESTSTSRGKFNGRGDRTPPNYADADGFETVEDWRCVPGCPVAMLDEQSGITETRPHDGGGKPLDTRGMGWRFRRMASMLADRGGASRFFYCAKASTQERNAGLEEVMSLFERRQGFEEKSAGMLGGAQNALSRGEDSYLQESIGLNRIKKTRNNHPTVKPITLLRYLCRLVTPPGGKVLDPFVGSGSTGCAAVLEGFQFDGIEKEKEYVEIAEARIEHWAATA